MRKPVFVLGMLYLLTAAGGGLLKVLHWNGANELLLAALPLGVAFWGVLLYFLLFVAGRRVG
jgi:hypothetical protein